MPAAAAPSAASNLDNEKLTLPAPPFRKVEGSRMQVFRVTLGDGARKFHTAIQAPDAAAAESKAADYFDTSKWQILDIRRAGVVAARPEPQSVAA